MNLRFPGDTDIEKPRIFVGLRGMLVGAQSETQCQSAWSLPLRSVSQFWITANLIL